MNNFKKSLKNVKAFAFDVDGVLSKACIPLAPSGEPMRMVNTKDGYALKQAILCGFPVAIITGGNTQALRVRFESLGVTDIYLSAKNKTEQLQHFLEKYDLKAENVLFMGDDIPDFTALKMVGVPTCPADAVPEIKEICCYISDKSGGEGCGRDVIEQVLKIYGKWMHNAEAFGW